MSELADFFEDEYDKLIDDLSRIIARCRFGSGVTMDGQHNPRPSEIRAAKDFIDLRIAPILAARAIAGEMVDTTCEQCGRAMGTSAMFPGERVCDNCGFHRPI